MCFCTKMIYYTLKKVVFSLLNIKIMGSLTVNDLNLKGNIVESLRAYSDMTHVYTCGKHLPALEKQWGVSNKPFNFFGRGKICLCQKRFISNFKI